MSATDGIIMMSEAPTYCSVLPLATVETISFGTPTAGTRNAGATSAVPPDPPAEIRPATSSCAAIQRWKASVMPATALPRSPVKTPEVPRGWWSATTCGGTSVPAEAPEVDRSTRRTRQPLGPDDVGG